MKCGIQRSRHLSSEDPFPELQPIACPKRPGTAVPISVILSCHADDCCPLPGYDTTTTPSHRLRLTNTAYLVYKAVTGVSWLLHKALLTCSSLYPSPLTTICALHSHSMYPGASRLADKTSFLDSPPQIRSALLSLLSLLTIGSNPGFLGPIRSHTPGVVNQRTRGNGVCVPRSSS